MGMRRVAIKADGGARVGLGHLGRCVALAQAFSHLGHPPVFLDVPSECVGWLGRYGFSHRRWADQKWDVLIGDSYRFTGEDLRRLRRQARTLLLFDDFGASGHPCDWLLCGRLDNPRWRSASGAGLLLGTRFQPLRRDYWVQAPPRPTPHRIRRCLITLGGGASGGLLQAAVAAAAQALPDAGIDVVHGPLADGRPWADRRIRLHCDLPSLRPLMLQSDAAVCAGGQTLLELAAAGVPAVAITRAKNQEANIAGLAAAGTSIPIGRWTKPDIKRKITLALRRLENQPEVRRRMSGAGRALVDGRGALRVARLLLS